MTVISGWLASVCRSRGERRRKGEKKKEKSERLKKDRGGKPHLCQACFQMDMKTDSSTERDLILLCCHQSTLEPLSFLVTVMMQSYAYC